MSETKIDAGTILSKEEIENQLAPYSENGFAAFFQKIWRWWLGVWSNFSEKKPKLAKFLYTFALFWLISNLVTILQGVLLNIIPNWFGMELAEKAFAWPGVSYEVFGEELKFIIFGYDAVKNAAGEVIIGGGLGYFYSFLIATFIAQCINFPMQRNFTYRSKGNIWYQAMWYFIGWLGINVVIWIIIGNLAQWNQAFIGISPAVLSWINVIIQGGVAMLVFYFIFLVIFPDVHASAEKAEVRAKNKKAFLDEIMNSDDEAKIDVARKDYQDALDKATRLIKLSKVKKAEKDMLSIKSTCEVKIIKVISLNKLVNKKKADNTSAEEINKLEDHLEQAIENASEAIAERDRIVKECTSIIVANS